MSASLGAAETVVAVAAGGVLPVGGETTAAAGTSLDNPVALVAAVEDEAAAGTLLEISAILVAAVKDAAR